MPAQRRTAPTLSRASQQWVLDWVIQETGKVFHFQTDGRGGLPRSVRSHAMISKHLGLAARRFQRLAEEEKAVGHRVTALARYFEAALLFANAQHVIFENNAEKRLLHQASIRSYDQVRELAPYRIEHIDIDWQGGTASGNLHLCPGDSAAPCVFFVPGCDQTKEMYPHPLLNHAHQRGMHVFSFDGPGQGECNLRGIKLTPINYEQAAAAAIDYLVNRPEIDANQIVVYGISFGSYWALRIAAYDQRVRAVAAPWSSLCEKYHLMDEDVPRFKQLFRYLTDAKSEADLDRIMAAMSLKAILPKITCPTLTAVGEYDPRSPLDEVEELFDSIGGPAELWVFADQHHRLSLTRPNAEMIPWLMDTHEMAIDWLGDRLGGKALTNERKAVYLQPGGGGPYSETRSHKRVWYDH
jgi:pimeloyl-ACP methyl ester carboxylesterase